VFYPALFAIVFVTVCAANLCFMLGRLFSCYTELVSDDLPCYNVLHLQLCYETKSQKILKKLVVLLRTVVVIV
jgi:hypothetical protein